MKNLTLSAVDWMMDLLIHTNGQTTTLEVKTALREIGYRADQAEVSRIMNELFTLANDSDTPIYNCENNGTFKIYTFTSVMTDHVPNAQDIVENEDEDENDGEEADYTIDSDDSVADFDFSKFVMTDNNTSANKSSLVNTVISQIKASREPQYVFYTEKHARDSKLDPKTWMVSYAYPSANSEIHAYDASLTRDQVRSRYASILKIKIQDVRAKRLSNF